MNNDLISRSALRKDIEHLYSVYAENKDWFYTAVLDHIDNAPTVDTTCPNCDSGYAQGYSDGYLKGKEERPQGEWILISERLPDRFDDVLITYQIPNREPKVRRALYVGGKFNFDNGDVWNWNDPEVKAWMPLPEAYKEAKYD